MRKIAAKKGALSHLEQVVNPPVLSVAIHSEAFELSIVSNPAKNIVSWELLQHFTGV